MELSLTKKLDEMYSLENRRKRYNWYAYKNLKQKRKVDKNGIEILISEPQLYPRVFIGNESEKVSIDLPIPNLTIIYLDNIYEIDVRSLEPIGKVYVGD